MSPKLLSLISLSSHFSLYAFHVLIHLSTPGSCLQDSGQSHSFTCETTTDSVQMSRPPTVKPSCNICKFHHHNLLKQECHCFKCTNIFPARSLGGQVKDIDLPSSLYTVSRSVCSIKTLLYAKICMSESE